MTRSAISASDRSVCWRSGKATLSNTDIEPNRAPSWNSTPILRRSASSLGIVRLGTDWPLTMMSPESGNISPIMCLISTLLPVPEGPSTTVIVSSGKATLRPLSTGTPPRRLCTSMQRIDQLLVVRVPEQVELVGVVLVVVGGRSFSSVDDVRELAGLAVEA